MVTKRFIIGIFLLIFGVWWMFSNIQQKAVRQTMVLVGNPMTVVSWDAFTRTLTLITLSGDVVAEGTHGYGMYSLEAFWKLGEIDKKDGSVLAESLSESLGIPVKWYIGPKTGLFPGADDVLTPVKRLFAFSNVLGIVGGKYRTNIPLSFFISMAWELQVGRPDRIKTFDFFHNDSFIVEKKELADGSYQQVLDPQRLDIQLARVFEDERARSESVTVAVYNTTAMPSLGNRVARLLGHLGVSVVTVGNDTQEVNACTVSGEPVALESVSAQIIMSVLKCKAIETTGTDRADLIVRMGKEYAKRFLPN